MYHRITLLPEQLSAVLLQSFPSLITEYLGSIINVPRSTNYLQSLALFWSIVEYTQFIDDSLQSGFRDTSHYKCNNFVSNAGVNNLKTYSLSSVIERRWCTLHAFEDVFDICLGLCRPRVLLLVIYYNSYFQRLRLNVFQTTTLSIWIIEFNESAGCTFVTMNFTIFLSIKYIVSDVHRASFST
jgi:hypothetical protein